MTALFRSLIVKKIADYAAITRMPVALHNRGSLVRTYASAHLSLAIQNFYCSESSLGQPGRVIEQMSNDYGWGDVSINNPDSVFQTPHLDRIAEEGLRFTNAHTPHSVCTPTRYAVLTGRYAWRTELREGVLVGYGKSLIRPGRMTLPALLKKHGYRTGAFGKWHLGLDWEPVEGDPGD